MKKIVIKSYDLKFAVSCGILILAAFIAAFFSVQILFNIRQEIWFDHPAEFQTYFLLSGILFTYCLLKLFFREDKEYLKLEVNKRRKLILKKHEIKFVLLYVIMILTCALLSYLLILIPGFWLPLRTSEGSWTFINYFVRNFTFLIAVLHLFIIKWEK